MSVFIVEEFINLSCVDNGVSGVFPFLSVLKEISGGHCVRTFKQLADELVVAPCRNALIAVVEIVVVEDQSYRQAFYDECRQVSTATSPLLLSVTLYQLFIYVAADEHERLLFKVAWLVGSVGVHAFYGLGFLSVNLGHGLLRCRDAPHLIERVHVERQIVELSFVVGHR